MLVGHTKFSLDLCFGNFKKAYSQRFVTLLFDIVEVMVKSSEVGTNIYQLVGLPDGTTIVLVYVYFFTHTQKNKNKRE